MNMPEERPRVAELSEQDKYEYYGTLNDARGMIFGEGGQQIIAIIQQAEDPADGIGQAAAQIVRALEDEADGDDDHIPENIINLVAAEIVTDIADLAHAAGVLSPQDQREAQQIAGKAFVDTARHYTGAKAQGA